MPQNPPAGYHTVVPQTVVEDARSTLDFIESVFGGKVLEVFEEEGRIRHSEAEIGDTRVMVASTSDEFGQFPFMVTVYVDDVDDAYERALLSGARALREPEDQFYGDRTAGVLDTQGNQWWISTHIEDVSAEEMQRRLAAMSG